MSLCGTWRSFPPCRFRKLARSIMKLLGLLFSYCAGSPKITFFHGQRYRVERSTMSFEDLRWSCMYGKKILDVVHYFPPKIRSGEGFRLFAFFGNVCTPGTSLSLTDDQLAFFCSWVNLFVGKIIFKHQKTLENSSRNDKTVNISIEKRLYFPQLGRDVPGTLGTKISLWLCRSDSWLARCDHLSQIPFITFLLTLSPG